MDFHSVPCVLIQEVEDPGFCINKQGEGISHSDLPFCRAGLVEGVEDKRRFAEGSLKPDTEGGRYWVLPAAFWNAFCTRF